MVVCVSFIITVAIVTVSLQLLLLYEIILSVSQYVQCQAKGAGSKDIVKEQVVRTL